MNPFESMKHIETTLDKLYDIGDDTLAREDDDFLRQDIATLNFLLITASELAGSIAESLGGDVDDISEQAFADAEEEFNGTEDDVIDGEFEDSSLDDSAEGEWR